MYKRQLLACIDAWRKEADFAAVLPLSALTGEGVDDLVACLLYTSQSGLFFVEQLPSRCPDDHLLLR